MVFISENVCFVERMNIKDSYRGFEIESKIFKDIVFHFGENIALFVLEPDISLFEIIKKNDLQLPLILSSTADIEPSEILYTETSILGI